MNKHHSAGRIMPGSGPRRAPVHGGPEAVVRGVPAKRVDAGVATKVQPTARNTTPLKPMGRR